MRKRTFWLSYIIAMFVVIMTMTKCTPALAANKPPCKIDTCLVNTESIQAFYIKTNQSTGKENRFMIYSDADQGIDDLIPIASSVYEYIMTCHATKVAPHLGIVFKNNIPSRVIKYRKMGCKPQKLPGKLIIYKKK